LTLLNPSNRPANTVKKFTADTPIEGAAQPEQITPAFLLMAALRGSRRITADILPILGGCYGG